MILSDILWCLTCKCHARRSVLIVFRLNRMHEMQTIVTSVWGICPSVCLSCVLRRWRCVQCTLCSGSFGAAFVKCLWPLVDACACLCRHNRQMCSWIVLSVIFPFVHAAVLSSFYFNFYRMKTWCWQFDGSGDDDGIDKWCWERCLGWVGVSGSRGGHECALASTFIQQTWEMWHSYFWIIKQTTALFLMMVLLLYTMSQYNWIPMIFWHNFAKTSRLWISFAKQFGIGQQPPF